MPYTSEYINKLYQFDALDCFLVISDNEGIMPKHLIPKSFKRDITDEELEAEASREIEVALAAYSESVIEQEPEL